VAKGEKQPEEAPKYHINELIAQSQAVFGVKPEVVVGAVYGCSGNELTVDEVKVLIKAFLERKVE